MPFREIYDVLTKSKILEGIYSDAEDMNRECKRIFEEAFDCLLEGKKDVGAEISDEDKIINKYEVKIREDILHYLAINRAPNLSASLILINVVTCYERIGDYCKGIAHLGLLYPAEFEGDEYRDITLHMKDTILKQFDLTYDGLKNSESAKAREVVESYQGVKTLHESLIEKLNKDKKIERNKAITYAALTIYLRRIGAHLKNICTAVLKPFPEFGFEKKEY